jgi:hypothetical protein
MRSWHWIVASGITFTAASAGAQQSGSAEPSAPAASAKADPSAKAARCAGKDGAEQGCTGFKPSLRPSAAAKRTAKASRPPDLDASLVQHLRPPTRLGQQSERLLVIEIARLEKLLAITPRNASDRAQLVRRIAEGYAELAAIAARRQMLAEEKVREAERRESRAAR